MREEWVAQRFSRPLTNAPFSFHSQSSTGLLLLNL